MKRKLITKLALVHLGSEAISMQIVEYKNLSKYKVVEKCNYPIKLGEETFKNKSIPYAFINEICDVLAGYKELMDTYAVDEYIVQATTAVREAKNQVFLLDQIKIKTDLDVEIVDMPQEIYTKYVSIKHTLEENKAINNNKGTLFMDISSGGLGITYLHDEKIKYQESFHVGIIRIKESFNRHQRNSTHFNKALSQFLASTIGPVQKALADKTVDGLVLTGTEIELVLKMLGYKEHDNVTKIAPSKFQALFKKVHGLNLNQIVQVFKLPESAIEVVLPTLLLYEQLLDLTPAKEIIITNDRFIDGMTMLHIAEQKNPEVIEALDKELISLVHHVGKRYGYDEAHAKQVERLSVLIYDKLGKKNGMDAHGRLILRAAALLHDIGKYVSMRSHSLYSYQLIMATDLLGFSEEDRTAIALAAYYHANNIFEEDVKNKLPLPSKEWIAPIAKLAAIVRAADALDRSYMQKIKSCKVNLKNDELIIEVATKVDLTLEEWTFANKVTMLEEVYGIKVRIERVG